jgi:hypothetical protein
VDDTRFAPVPPPLVAELAEAYGDVLPPALITSTVEAAAVRPPDAPPADEAARQDVAALAEAVKRAASSDPVTA